MIVDGATRLQAAPEAVLAVLADPERFATALPNVDPQEWQATGPGAFDATIRPRIALGEVPFRTAWTVGRPAKGAVHYAVEGRGDEHRLGMVLRVVVESDGTGSRVTWVADLTVSGTMRSVGQRVLPAIVAAQARIALQAVDLEAGTPAAP